MGGCLTGSLFFFGIDVFLRNFFEKCFVTNYKMSIFACQQIDTLWIKILK